MEKGASDGVAPCFCDIKSAKLTTTTSETSAKGDVDAQPEGWEEKLDSLTEALIDEAPRLRRYAHAILAHWPPPRHGGETRSRVDAAAEAIAVEALFDVARAAPHPEALRRTLYRRVTALARLECAREAATATRCAVGGATPRTSARPRFAENHPAAQDFWPAELTGLKNLGFSPRAALALVAIEHFTHDEAAAILDAPTPRLLALLAVARQNLNAATSGAPRGHLRALTAQDVAPGDLLKYVDGELNAVQRDDVAAFLDAHPTRGRECARWRQLDDNLRQSFGPLLRAPPPRALEAAIKARQAKAGFWARLARFFSSRAEQSGVAPRPL